jgi:hypothetical protein
MNPDGGTLTYYRDLRANSGLWSCCGYEGLAVVFDLPLEAVRSLPEDRKRAIMGLLKRLAEPGAEELRDQARELDGRNCEDRLAGILRLSAQVSG